MPLLGPSSLRDAIGQAVDCTLLPTTYYKKTAIAYYPASYLITQAKITSIQYDLGETFDDGYEALRNTYLMSRGDDDVRGTEGTAKTTDLATEQPPDLLDDDDVRGTEGTAKTTDSATEQPPDLLD
jgi:ABC-type transporter lipoprotein component MlaA